ncbi:NADP-dependent oxidoreductase [Rhodococcus tibetensis]|uniref:NADP-dependent oxidoreductase n=1 Tax=Rhodococcus tibetensis TaxID=2965064 RepID=A0ABT1QK67_9NOCA|nr:NADP-dependent oxidoreductase [Rhodococcus sp. FXJ9.536]MCQ4122038.1 NADP-dependent oxidoreductase [Rhodococcus sp. FXJ9.536]
MSTAYGFREYGSPGTQQFFDVHVPSPGAGQLQVAVHAAGVNPADWKVRAGTRKDTVPITLPAVLGREVAGVVTAVGPRVTEFAVGDAVFGATATGYGGYAEHTMLNASSTAHKPESVSFADAATLPVAAGTAYDAMAMLNLPAGSRLLVIGAGGGVGVAALQLAAARGITVLGVASRSKREVVESLGAEWVESGAELTTRISEPVDAVFDLVGGSALADAAGLAREPASIISIGDPLAARDLGGSGVERRRTTAAFTELAALVATGVLDPRVTHRFPLTQAGEALATVESGHTAGKVVIEVG